MIIRFLKRQHLFTLQNENNYFDDLRKFKKTSKNVVKIIERYQMKKIKKEMKKEKTYSCRDVVV